MSGAQLDLFRNTAKKHQLITRWFEAMKVTISSQDLNSMYNSAEEGSKNCWRIQKDCYADKKIEVFSPRRLKKLKFFALTNLSWKEISLFHKIYEKKSNENRIKSALRAKSSTQKKIQKNQQRMNLQKVEKVLEHI